MEASILNNLILEVGTWSVRCFGNKQASDLGVVEELGEAVHCILKRFQAIRGYDNPVKFNEEVGDAFGDMGIYMLNHAGFHHIPMYRMDTDSPLTEDCDRWYIAKIMQQLAHILLYNEYRRNGMVVDRAQEAGHMSLLWAYISRWATSHGFDFDLTVQSTWAKVQKRQWDKDRLHAAAVAEQGGTEVPKALDIPPAGFVQGAVTQNEPGGLPTASVAQIPVSPTFHPEKGVVVGNVLTDHTNTGQ